MGISLDIFTKSYNNVIDYYNSSLLSENNNRENFISNYMGPLCLAYTNKDEKNIERILEIISSKYSRFSDMMPSYYNKYKRKKERVNKQLVEENYNALKGQFKDFEILQYYKVNEYISWQSNITIVHNDPLNNNSFEVDLGIFKFTFIEKEEGKYFIGAEPIDKNKITKGGSYHPHIQKGTGKVCIGSYDSGVGSETGINEDMRNSDIFSIMRNVTTVLCNYNGSSVFSEDISAWIGHKCPVCFQYIPLGAKTSSCTKRMEIMHEDCSIEHNGKKYNPILLKECNVCGKDNVSWIVKNGLIICEECL